MRVWILVEQGDTPMVVWTGDCMEKGVEEAQQYNTEKVTVDEIENTEDAYEIRGDEIYHTLQLVTLGDTAQ